MAPHTALWISLVVGAVLFGVSLVAILVSRRSLEPVFAALALAAFACAAWAFGELSIVYDRFDVLLWALAFGVAAFAGGYALASTLLASLASRPRAARRARRPPSGPRVRGGPPARRRRPRRVRRALDRRRPREALRGGAAPRLDRNPPVPVLRPEGPLPRRGRIEPRRPAARVRSPSAWATRCAERASTGSRPRGSAVRGTWRSASCGSPRRAIARSRSPR